MPIVNFKLEGEMLSFVEEYIKAGYATSKAEVIRLALLKMLEEDHQKLALKQPKPPEHDKSIR
ncbi:MAG: hypothetical protein WC492_01590 [Candidatus Micrarchaeia archaeon]